MLKSETALYINRLSDALRTSFEWIVKRDREGVIVDIGEAWAELTASALQDVILMAPPIVDHTEPFLPFIETHKIRTDLSCVARSGMRGGPRLDLIFQVWFDTEDASGGFGVPLIIQKIPSAGRITPHSCARVGRWSGSPRKPSVCGDSMRNATARCSNGSALHPCRHYRPSRLERSSTTLV